MSAQTGTVNSDSIWNDVDPDIAGDLDQSQKTAIVEALSRRMATDKPADVRVSLLGFYFVARFGRERRSAERLKAERRSRPLITINNLPLIIVLWGSVVFTSFAVIMPVIRKILVMTL